MMSFACFCSAVLWLVLCGTLACVRRCFGSRSAMPPLSVSKYTAKFLHIHKIFLNHLGIYRQNVNKWPSFGFISYLCGAVTGDDAGCAACYRLFIFKLKDNKAMKKILVSFCLAAVMTGLSSCGSSKYVAATVADIDGEWNIIEINGSSVVPAPGQAYPYIGFDQTTGRVHGNAGCNRLMGTFDVQAEPGRIDLSQLGTTRMMCPDMTVEQNVLNALAQVKRYVKLDGENIALCGKSARRPILVLKKKAPDMTIADLNGKWKVVEAMGVAVPDSLENQPFVELNVAERKLHGQAGCNLINGNYETEEGNPASISFPPFISTMMACPDMETEDRVKQALNATRSFGRVQEGHIGFYDADQTLVMVLAAF